MNKRPCVMCSKRTTHIAEMRKTEDERKLKNYKKQYICLDCEILIPEG